MSKIIKIALLSLMVFIITGCENSSREILNDMDSGEFTLIFRTYANSVYKIKYEGKTYIVSNQGGIIEIDDSKTFLIN